MRMKTTDKPMRNSFPILRQICNLIPRYVFGELCGRREFDTRGHSERSRFAAMLYAHLSHAASPHPEKAHRISLSCGLLRHFTPFVSD